MSFSRVRGQERAVAALRSSLASGRLAHGYLLTGPAGVGKRTLAMQLCRAALCEAGGDDACGRCRSCLAFDAGNSWEFSAICTEGDKGEMRPVDDSDREIKVGSVRALERELALRCDKGRRRCALIPGAERLNEEAQNALLKTLEEPPEGRLLVLTSGRPGALLPTVISRLARVRLRPLSAAEVAACLVEDHGRAGAEAKELAEACGGSIGAALAADVGELRAAREFAERELCGRPEGPAADHARRMCSWAKEHAGSGRGAEPVRRALLGAFAAGLATVRQAWIGEVGSGPAGDAGSRRRRCIEALMRAERAIAAYVTPELVCRVLAGELREA